jgi:hypothetical protein
MERPRVAGHFHRLLVRRLQLLHELRQLLQPPFLQNCLPLSNRTQQANTLANHYERIRSQRGTGGAIIALARKFLGIMYRTLKKNWVLEDFPNFALKPAAA